MCLCKHDDWYRVRYDLVCALCKRYGVRHPCIAISFKLQSTTCASQCGRCIRCAIKIHLVLSILWILYFSEQLHLDAATFFRHCFSMQWVTATRVRDTIPSFYRRFHEVYNLHGYVCNVTCNLISIIHQFYVISKWNWNENEFKKMQAQHSTYVCGRF